MAKKKTTLRGAKANKSGGKYNYKQAGQVMGKGAVKESRQSQKNFKKKYAKADKMGLKGAVRLSAAMSTGKSAG